MRIACYGFVERHAGSVASANALLLDGLLGRGHTVDFYAVADFVRPEEYFEVDGFAYHGVLLDWPRRVEAAMPGGIRRLVDPVFSRVRYGAHLRAIGERVAEDHRRRPYDVLLFLGLGAPFAVPGLPVVSWFQGPPQTEWDALARLRGEIVDLAGWSLYLKLKAFYAYKHRAARAEFARSDRLICGSAWSRRHVIAFGARPDAVHALPYPFDLDLFHPEPPAPPHDRRTLLWLGRIDPRKRLGLLLDAFRLLVDRYPDVDLRVVGRLTYAPEYRRLLDAFEPAGRLAYDEGIPRPDVPALLRAADVLVQPSESENFGSSVAEALACGTPVVLGPTNGTGEYAGDAACRFDAYTPAALADALAACLDRDPAEAARTARRTAETAFAAETVVEGLERVLHAAVADARETTA